MDYATYIGSAAWRRNPARLAALSDAEGHCRLCHADARLEVHHSTYERLGSERAADLIVLCCECHRDVTSLLRERRYSSVKPKRADIDRLHDARILPNDPTAGGY